jgi:LSD1 subclass zinc finger protein
MNANNEAIITASFKCQGCGAVLHFVPGTRELKCDYCGETNVIASATKSAAIESVEYAGFLKTINSLPLNPEIKVVKCTSCGSETSFNGNESAGKCAFCASPLVIQLGKSASTLKPHYILPFVLNENQAGQKFNEWLAGLWFAPKDIVREARANTSLKGIYMPYWTYDCNTTTHYIGERGDHYYTTETYTVQVNGKTETRTRQVQHTSWSNRSGKVFCDFQDITVPASKSLPSETLTALNPWDFKALQSYDERYVSGLSAETYQINPDEGLETAKAVMSPTIIQAIHDDIGGDEQRISSSHSQYNNIAIKYVMLPVWVSAYTYDKQIYQFAVNACTGEVIGKRPYSVIKIVLAIILGIALVAAIVIGIAYIKAQNETREVQEELHSIGMLKI